MQLQEMGGGGRRGKETSVHETAVSLHDTERVCSRAAGVAFRRAQVEPRGPRGSRTETDGRVTTPRVRPHPTTPTTYLFMSTS